MMELLIRHNKHFENFLAAALANRGTLQFSGRHEKRSNYSVNIGIVAFLKVIEPVVSAEMQLENCLNLVVLGTLCSQQPD